MYYAGIGSRQTPPQILTEMTLIAMDLAQLGYTLRSGGAIGADIAFEKGAGHMKSIFRANDATRQAINLAASYHPAWHLCNDYVRKLHGRNMNILLGLELNTPVEFVVCWTANGQPIGGTGQALRYAIQNHIKIYNIANRDQLIALRQFIAHHKP